MTARAAAKKTAGRQREGRWKRTASKHTNIRLPLDLRQRLEGAAERENRTLSSMGGECIRRALDAMEGVHAHGAGQSSAGSAAT